MDSKTIFAIATLVGVSVSEIADAREAFVSDNNHNTFVSESSVMDDFDFDFE